MVLAEELAVHDWDAPEALIAEFLRLLKAIAKVTYAAADLDPLLLGTVPDAVVTSGRRARENALTDSRLQRFGQCVDAESEHEDRHAGPSVGSLTRRDIALDRRFDIARDHARRVPAQHRRSRSRPPFIGGGDDQPRGLNRKRFGKRVDDFDAVEIEGRGS